MICPDCGNAIITNFPPGMLWERCPSCRIHVWDEHDTLMADEYRGTRRQSVSLDHGTEN
jgi:hypothetical protein